MVFVLLLLVIVAVVVAAVSVGPSTDLTSAAGNAGVNRVVTVLVRRYVMRLRRFRVVGGLLALIVALNVMAIRASESNEGGDLTVDLGELLAWGIAGSILGTVCAELRVRRPRGARTAALSARTADRYVDGVTERRERVVLAVSIGALAVAVLTRTGAVEVVVWTVAVAILSGLRRWLGSLVALRPRPNLPPDLERADDYLRRISLGPGLGRPIMTLAMLAASRQWVVLHEHHEDPASAAVAVVGLATAVIWWWGNRKMIADPDRRATVLR